MIKAIATLSICCVLGGGILLGTVEDEQTVADMPRTPQIVDLSNFNDNDDILTENEEVVLKTGNRRSVKTESVKTVKATTEATVPSKPQHQHKWVAVYKTTKEQTGAKQVIHKYCYKCKADITNENIEEHLKSCGTDMYTTKKMTEPVFSEIQIVDYWICECGERKTE